MFQLLRNLETTVWHTICVLMTLMCPVRYCYLTGHQQEIQYKYQQPQQKSFIIVSFCVPHMYLKVMWAFCHGFTFLYDLKNFVVVLCYGHVVVDVGVVVRRQWGFCSITLVLWFGSISNFKTMIPYIKYRLGLILGDLALTVFKEGPKGDFSIFKCNFFIFCPIDGVFFIVFLMKNST